VKAKKQKGLARENRPGLNAAHRSLPFDPHLVQIISAELRTDQTDAGDGNDNDNESAQNSKRDHGASFQALPLLTPSGQFRSTHLQNCNDWGNSPYNQMDE
jgi:hypothetical protein